jgi:formylglycine-generating enzyme required for sulfatase activity
LPDIFVSYARSDRARVEAIATALASEGFSVWWDREIQPGETFRGEIEKALSEAKCVIVVWSKDSVKRNWVIEEAQEGLDRGVLVPVLVDDVVGDLPRGFKSVQAADLTQWRGGREDANWQVVRSRIARLAQPTGEPVSTARRFAFGNRQLIALGLLTLCALTAASFYAASQYADRSTTSELANLPSNGFMDCDRCPQMIVIPAGSFVMGSPPAEQGRFENEAPQRKVSFAKPLAVGRFEVTFDEWDACVEAGSCPSADDLGWGKARLPVINVSWTDVQSYLVWLRRVTGKDYRLLTEAEWEYAARAGSASRYGFGDRESDLCTYGNGADQTVKSNRSGWSVSSCSDSFERTSPVGSFKPNQFGLYDMHGNVWEWVEDCFVESYSHAKVDGRASTSGDCSVRALRGGAWFSSPSVLRSASRGKATVNTRSFGYGLRVARELD